MLTLLSVPVRFDADYWNSVNGESPMAPYTDYPS